ncbi:MAG TPA: hypothetical protein VM266_06910 [Solirubrobacteraceae bacterium]|nr:hypothetical protein [Solirubrobacteraceae bacterium]
MKRTLAIAALLTAAVAAAPVVAAPPDNAVNVVAKPKTVVFGKSTVLSGQVTGSGNGGVSVTLQSTPAPYTEGFKNVGNPVTTDANGFYSFTVTPQVNTRYRVTAKAKPTVESAPVEVLVRPRVTLRVSDKTPRRGQRVRFAGVVTPAHDGAQARIQRRTRSGWRTLKTTTLAAATPVEGVTRSRYSVRMRVRRDGRYRAFVVTGDADHAPGRSRARRLRVH